MEGRTGCHAARGCAVIDKGNETRVRVPKQWYRDRGRWGNGGHQCRIWCFNAEDRQWL